MINIHIGTNMKTINNIFILRKQLQTILMEMNLKIFFVRVRRIFVCLIVYFKMLLHNYFYTF